MIISYKNIRYVVQEIKSCTTSNGVKIYLFKNSLALAGHHYIVACKSLEQTLLFEFCIKLPDACELYLETICRYA